MTAVLLSPATVGLLAKDLLRHGTFAAALDLPHGGIWLCRG